MARIISSLKRDAIRAAQNASAASIWLERGLRILGLPLPRLEERRPRCCRATGCSGYRTFVQSRCHRPNDNSPLAILSPSIRYSLPPRGCCADVLPLPRVRAEVLEVVPDVAAAVLLDIGVDAVDRSRIVVIQPCGEHAQAAQLAPPLVRVDVVRIVRPRAGEAELSRRPCPARSGWPARESCRRPCRGCVFSQLLHVGHRRSAARSPVSVRIFAPCATSSCEDRSATMKSSGTW